MGKEENRFFFYKTCLRSPKTCLPGAWRLAAQDSGGGSVWQCQVYGSVCHCQVYGSVWHCQVYGSVCHCQVCGYFLAWPGRAWPSPLYCSEVAFSRDRRLLGSGVTAGHCQPGGEGQAADIMDVTLAWEGDQRGAIMVVSIGSDEDKGLWDGLC